MKKELLESQYEKAFEDSANPWRGSHSDPALVLTTGS